MMMFVRVLRCRSRTPTASKSRPSTAGAGARGSVRVYTAVSSVLAHVPCTVCSVHCYSLPHPHDVDCVAQRREPASAPRLQRKSTGSAHFLRQR